MIRALLSGVATLCLVASAAAAEIPEGDAAKGEVEFQGRCAICHFHDSADKKIGPGLAGIKDGKLPSDKESTRENLLENINKGGNGMPAMEAMMEDTVKYDIIAYVLTL